MFIYNIIVIVCSNNNMGGVNMNKYQELLQAIKTNYGEESEYYKTTKELVDKETPTLEEVKKEWEELGYTFFEDDTHIKLYYCGGQVYIFDKKEKGIIVFPFITPFRTLNLLSKTLKALGWEE